MSVLQVLAACTALAVALGVAFVGLLALTLSLTSDARISAHLREASERGVFAGLSYPHSPFGHGGHRYDMYTDCVAFGMNLGNTEQPLMQRIAASPTAGTEGGAGPCEDLAAAARSGAVHASANYLRFWHGYQVYLRPLMSVLPLDAVLRVTALLFFAALIFFAWRLQLLFGAWAWAIALPPFFLFADFFTVPMVTTHALSLIWAFFPAALVPVILERVPKARAMVLPLFVFAAGASYNFLNFLVNPPLAPALIAFFYIACNLDQDEKRTVRVALYAGGLAALWFCGFAAAWLEKWVFAALVLGPDAVMAELTRVVAKYDATRVRLEVNFLGASRRNVQYGPIAFAYILASLAAAAAAVGWSMRKHGGWRIQAFNFIAMLAPLAVIVFWVEANRAHSAEHVGFVSRSFLLFSILPLLAAIKVWRDAAAGVTIGAPLARGAATAPATR